MRALVSGQAGIAVLIDGTRVSSMGINSPELLPCSMSDIARLFADASDVSELPNATRENALAALDLAWRQDRALQLLLILLDRNSSKRARALSVGSLEELLGNLAVRNFVRDRVYSAPLPSSADLIGSLLQAESQKAASVGDFLEKLGRLQANIRVRRSEWDGLSAETCGGERRKQELGYAFAVRGVFRQLVEASDQGMNEVLISSLSDPLLKRLPAYRETLTAWIQPVKLGVGAITRRDSERADRAKERRSRASQDNGRLSRSRKPKRLTLASVVKQREAIKEAIREGREGRVADFVQDLVESQLKQGEKESVIKSLCALATFAKSVGATKLQLDLALRAVRIMPEYGWSQAQLADAYLLFGRSEEAYLAYVEAEKYAATAHERIVARSGRAEVLKAMGRLGEALDAYDAVVADSSADVVARSGRAEVLKAMGRLGEALGAYDSAILDFPEDVVARTGRAEVLKTMGRLGEALAAYDSVIADFSESVVARTGRAEVLKAMGRLGEALAAYDSVIADFSESVVARTGRAEVLKAMGRLGEALAAYDSLIGDFSDDVVARNGRAEVLKAMGRLGEALAAYDSVIADFSENVVARNGRAEVLKAMGRLVEALREYDDILVRFGNPRYARTGRLSVLVLLDRYQDALREISNARPETQDDWVDYHLRGMIALRTHDIPTATRIFEDGVKDSPWYDTRGPFRRALAVARLSESRFVEALESLADECLPIADVLRLHALGVLGETERAKESLARVRSIDVPVVVSLREELADRYLTPGQSGPHKSDHWVFERECEMVMAA
jgi:tetratricopeptide (TPR) repeat protein